MYRFGYPLQIYSGYGYPYGYGYGYGYYPFQKIRYGGLFGRWW